jgi:(1->4)-alpha-D-glucan 1-alpha-D-glucosylmutase
MQMMPEDLSDDHAVVLNQLCAHFGIATEYCDIRGARQLVARESLLALLAEFDVVVGGAGSAEAALADAQRATWRQALPPVLAIQSAAQEWGLSLRMPASMTRVQWHLSDETGAQLGGGVDVEDLPEVARAEIDGVMWCERRLSLTLRLPAGYHRFSVAGLSGETLVVSAPDHCYRPTALKDDGKVWGPSVQLYSLRSKHNWGIGDFSDLVQLIKQLAERGADMVGLNPLHALFSHNPAHASPYSPSSRLQLNVLYIDVEAVDDFDVCELAQRLVFSPEFQARLAVLRETQLIDYAGVAEAKFEVLELLFSHFREHHLSADGAQARDDAGRAFLDFVAQRGELLYRHALFEALQAHFHEGDSDVWGWPVWPEAYRDPASAEVGSFAELHAVRVEYHQYLQWLAACQLARASDHCQALGLGVGLYLDLAVSVDRGGSDAWSERACFAVDASVGAPPDEFNLNGQAWGLPPLRPDRLRASHYDYFIETLRANMRGAGALRIDHVMGLMRLFWIPRGQTGRDGAYVHYALDEMLAIVALESQRNRCMVIGEDLGTVTDEVREALARFNVLSYRLLYFERQDSGDFKPASDYPTNALVAVSTHDLATLAGWWSGRDLRLRLQLGLYPDMLAFEAQILARAQERVRLLLALQHADLLSASEVADALAEPKLSAHAVGAVHAFLAAAPCRLMTIQLEDVLGVSEQVNMPGTTEEQPNWRRKLPMDLKALASHEELLQLSRILSGLRPRRSGKPIGGSHTQAKVPRATYRLQFHKGFGFDDAIRILPYLARLGISHVYCSPIQRARVGSTHGYDVVAHNEVNPELGGPEGFDRFTAALRQHGMGLLLDLVPNHMGVLGGENAWWTDVLENGPASLYAQHFDIDWQPLNPELTGKVMLPVLGDHYGDVLMSGKLALQFDDSAGSLALRYFDHRFPLAPESYPSVLMLAQARLGDVDLAASLASTATAFGHLPGRNVSKPGARSERSRDKELLKSRLARLAGLKPEVAQAIRATVAELNLAGARDDLHTLIEAQAYRLAYWRVAADEINYRRFFDINELAALRMEREEVFEATQSFALDLAAAGVVDGLRIDHPDGLYDPARYFAQLQEGYARRAGLILPDKDDEGRPVRPLYVVAEKITASHEEVPESWHIHGMTGYRFANLANGLFVDKSASGRFETIWRNFTGISQSFGELARDGRRDIIRTALASELNVLSTELLRIAHADRKTRDYTQNALRRALSEVAACMPVYRTYFIEKSSVQDQRFVDWAVRDAERHSQDADLSIFAFVRQILLGQAVPDAPESLCERVRRFAIRFQQFSAPVAAKGVEDTAFYRYFPLSSLNEVGGEPDRFGITVAGFHEASAFRAQHWPYTMLATSTHDNKRSEDVRNRIDVLSEIPASWRLALRRWRGLNHGVRQRLEAGGAPVGAPSHADEYLLYQTLLGTMPAEGLNEVTREPYCERIVQYMLKAARESKMHTRWTHPDESYESALEGFVRALLGSASDNQFLDQLHALSAKLAWFGALSSLSMTLLKFTSPGVPDLYQGHEIISLALVDPDNRRPVDYEALAHLLSSLEALDPAQLLVLAAAPQDGRAKLWIAWRLLALRRERPALFRDGDYTALKVSGLHAEHVVAFARHCDGATLLVIAGRLFVRLMGESTDLPLGDLVWVDTAVSTDLPDGMRLTNVLSGETLTVENGRISLCAAFSRLPAAVFLALT